ncbi:MAG: hypothetical protein WCL70_04705 [Paludibacter sp.]
MKTFIFIGLLLISVVFTACDLTGSSNTTPQILFLDKPRLNTKDSLLVKYTDGVYVLDSICVGDTVTFEVGLNGFTNNLKSYNLNLSDTTSTKLLLPNKISLDSIFSTTLSNYSIGKFVFKTGIYQVYFPFSYLARKETNEAKITFILMSDAVFNGNGFDGSNYTSFTIKTPIKKTKAPN